MSANSWKGGGVKSLCWRAPKKKPKKKLSFNSQAIYAQNQPPLELNGRRNFSILQTQYLLQIQLFRKSPGSPLNPLSNAIEEYKFVFSVGYKEWRQLIKDICHFDFVLYISDIQYAVVLLLISLHCLKKRQDGDSPFTIPPSSKEKVGW